MEIKLIDLLMHDAPAVNIVYMYITYEKNKIRMTWIKQDIEIWSVLLNTKEVFLAFNI